MDLLMSEWFDWEDAVISCLIADWTSKSDKSLGRTILQKLIYFAKAKGVPMMLNYEIYHYGPYCQELSERVDYLQVGNIIDDKGSDNQSNYKPSSEANKLLEMYGAELQESRPMISHIVDSFIDKSPHEMELFATTHFVEQGGENDITRIVREVQRIKGRKFSQQEIEQAVSELHAKGY